MSIATLIIGQSGTGKSTSMRNLDPETTLLIQTVKKPLPFRSANWKETKAEKNDKGETVYTGSVKATTDTQTIVKLIQNAERLGKEVIVIDDFQYIMASSFMERASEKGYEKFTDMAKQVWDITNAALSAPDNIRVYFLTHSQEDEYGSNVRMKTLGKLLDDKVTMEGLFSIVLRSHVKDGKYYFTTQNDGTDTVKSPMGLFESFEIDNDLKQIDEQIKEYYGI